MDEKIKIEEYIKIQDYTKKDNEDCTITKASKHALNINFNKIFSNEYLSEELNKFILKPKQAYYNNMDLYVPYINYFIKYFDDDNELPLAYLKLKFLADRGDNKIQEKVFLENLYTCIMTPSMIEKIKNMVEYNYKSPQKSKKKNFKYKAIEFNEDQCKILLCISTAIKICIPPVTHYIYMSGIYNNKRTDEFLGESFFGIIKYFQEDNNLYNKIYEFILSKINKYKHSDKKHWETVEILGIDIASETQKVLMKLLVDIIYKYNFVENIIALNSTSIKNCIKWSLQTNFHLNLRQLSDVKNEEGLSDFDKIEMNMSKFDESYIIMGKINIEQCIDKLKKKYDVKFTKESINYYNKYLSINKLQRKLIFNFFAKYFGNIRDEYSSLTKKNYIKLIIIFKKMMKIMGFDFIQHILSGVVCTNPNVKKLSKKEVQYIVKSDLYKLLEEKYKSTFDIISDEKVFFSGINNILSSKILLVDYDNKDKTHSEIKIKENRDVIKYEYLKLIGMI